MGQSESKPNKLTREQVSHLFAQKCAKQYSGIEIWSLKETFKELADDESGVTYWKEETLLKYLNIPDSFMVGSLLFKSASFLAAFPFLSTMSPAPLTLEGLVKVLSFFNGRYKGLLKNDYDITRLLFMSFATIVNETQSEKKERNEKANKHANDSGFDEKDSGDKDNQHVKEDAHEDEDEDMVMYTLQDVEKWDEFDSIKKIDQVSDKIFITGHDLYLLFTFLLSIMHIKPFDSMAQYMNSAEFDSKTMVKFKNSALCLIRTMHSEVSTVSSLKGVEITFAQFKPAFEAAFPKILDPLGRMLDHFLFYRGGVAPLPSTIEQNRGDEHEAKYQTADKLSSLAHSKLLNLSIRSQIESFSELNLDRVIKLYAGSVDGFSMRSFETNVFKWSAPTLLLVSGKTLTEKSSNLRQKSFDELIPPAKMLHQDSVGNNDSSASLASSHSSSTSSSTNQRHRVTFGVFVETPWRASSKECFASNKTWIFQLSPAQEKYPAKSVLSPGHYAYFCRSNPGPGGIGFGSPLPSNKNRDHQTRFELGNVSLTIEESLEFAVFRHLGGGGSFAQSQVHPGAEYEYRFSVDEIEVWGCGTDDDLASQKAQWEWEEREAQYRQRVNLKNGDHTEDRALLEMAGLVGQYQSGGSV